jgi:hypothetical protein
MPVAPKHLMLIAVALSAAVSVAACGGDSDSPSNSSSGGSSSGGNDGTAGEGGDGSGTGGTGSGGDSGTGGAGTGGTMPQDTRPPGGHIVTSGEVSRSTNWVLVSNLGEEPGGLHNDPTIRKMTSAKYYIANGVIGVAQK